MANDNSNRATGTTTIELLQETICEIHDAALAIIAAHGGDLASYPDCKAKVFQAIRPLVGNLSISHAWLLASAIELHHEVFHPAEDCPALEFPRYLLLDFVKLARAGSRADAMARLLCVKHTLDDEIEADDRERKAIGHAAYEMAVLSQGKGLSDGDTFAIWGDEKFSEEWTEAAE